MSDFPVAVLRTIKKRSRGICEGCGLAPATESHHRQYRARGGPSVAGNGLHLCGWGNHTGCHGIAHTAVGEARGWAIRSGFDPLVVPVLVVVDFTKQWVRFDNAGNRESVHEADAIEYMTLIRAMKAVA